jgi:biopolymer transport protein ExbD
VILRRREARRARIEIVPMIDVVFFLLVFFMMASLSMAVYGGLPVNLPQAATGQVAPAETASVTIDREGRVFLNREPVAVAELEGRVRPILRGNPALAIVINADGDAAHHHVVAVLDALRLAGVSRMAIAVAPLPEPRR